VAFIREYKTTLSIRAKETGSWYTDCVFDNLACVSEFFETCSIGYSPGKSDFDGLELKAYTWEVTLLDVEEVTSSFFENRSIFPEGSVKFDNALIMKSIEHEWIGLEKIKTFLE